MPSPKAIDESALGLSQENIQLDLEQRLGKEAVLGKLIERLAHAGDASIYRMIPQAVLMPRRDEDIQAILEYCRERNLPVTFRAAGTSLSGQAVTDGILVSLGRHWRNYNISEDGRTVSAQPGVVGGKLNAILSRRGCKIGPDPASINAAMIGGIVANNASGLCCGIDQNSYRTLRGIRLILADGYLLDTSWPDAGLRLERDRPQLVRGLLRLREEILGQRELAARIRHKYRIKNTTGYSLNALIDFEDPVEILSHLMVGSEGTLGFISQVTLDTIPLPKFWATALVYFRDLRETGESIFRLREMGAAVVEFMDRASLLSVQDRMQYSFKPGPDCAALLVEFQENDESVLADKIKQAVRAIPLPSLIEPVEFTMDPEVRRHYWSMRKGIYPTVGAMRKRGAAVLIEDVVFPIDRIPEAIPDLQSLIQRSGFPDGVIFGHAKEGNFHPVITHDFSNERVVKQYAEFMNALADLVLNRYDGSFKGEHGTGRNVAPFVELEWGAQAYRLMYRIKELLDPSGILNPGVILNPDPEAHLKHLKPMPVFSEIADACIECGFCEVRCPSQDITLSPRQRIAVQRQIVDLERRGDAHSRQQAKTLEEEYLYYGVDTCAVDGMCAMACPVKIDTGRLAKQLREARRTKAERFMANAAARNFGPLVSATRIALGVTRWIERLLGKEAIVAASKAAHWLSRGALPALAREIPLPGAAPKLPPVPRTAFERTVVYFPSCLTRAMGSLLQEKSQQGLAETVIFILNHFGWNVVYPPGVSNLCCGQPFSSKGFISATETMTANLIRALWKASEQGQLPILCDTSPCSGQLLRAGEYLSEPELSCWRKMKLFDMPTFLVRQVLPREPVLKKLPIHAVLHPTCTIMKIGAEKDLIEAAERCAERVTVPVMAECCGFAGDRGFHHPELTLSATADEAREVLEYARQDPDAMFLSTCRTCEMGVAAGSGLPYRSIAYLVADTIRANLQPDTCERKEFSEGPIAQA